MNKILIVVDTKEKKIQKELTELGCEYKIQQLKIGDIIFVNENKTVYLVIERKTLNDFIESTKTERKKEQIWRLKNTLKNAKPYYLIEGSYIKNPRKRKMIYTGIVNIELRDCIQVHRTKSAKESAYLIMQIKKTLEKYGKPNTCIVDRAESFFGQKIKRNETINPFVFFKTSLIFIPGIGPKRATQISEKYKSFGEFIRDNGKKIENKKLRDKIIKFMS
jgi:ERCC4-type nuclease